MVGAWSASSAIVSHPSTPRKGCTYSHFTDLEARGWKAEGLAKVII